MSGVTGPGSRPPSPTSYDFEATDAFTTGGAGGAERDSGAGVGQSYVTLATEEFYSGDEGPATPKGSDREEPLFDFSLDNSSARTRVRTFTGAVAATAAGAAFGYRVLAPVLDSGRLAQFFAEIAVGVGGVIAVEAFDPDRVRMFANRIFPWSLEGLVVLTQIMLNSESLGAGEKPIYDIARASKTAFAASLVSAHALGLSRKDGGAETAPLVTTPNRTLLATRSHQANAALYAGGLACLATGIAIGQLDSIPDLPARFSTYLGAVPLGAQIVDHAARTISANRASGHSSPLVQIGARLASMSSPFILAGIATASTARDGLIWPLIFLGLAHGAQLAQSGHVFRQQQFSGQPISLIEEFRKRLANLPAVIGNVLLLSFITYETAFDSETNGPRSQTLLATFTTALYATYVVGTIARNRARAAGASLVARVTHFITNSDQLLFPLCYMVIRTTTRMNDTDVEAADSRKFTEIAVGYTALAASYGTNRANASPSQTVTLFQLQRLLPAIVIFLIGLYAFDEIQRALR